MLSFLLARTSKATEVRDLRVLGRGGLGGGGRQEGALFGGKCTWASEKQEAPGP